MPHTLTAAELSRTRLMVGAAVLFCACDAYAKLSAMKSSSILVMPYVPYWPGLSALHPIVPLLLWIPLGLLVAAGVAPRLVGGLLVTTMAFVLLGDQRTYSNHLYFLILLLFLLSFAPSRRRLDESPALPVFLLKCQASILYGFGALAKLTPAYLTGWMLAGTIDRRWWSWIPLWEQTPLLFAGVAVLTIIVEAGLAVGLWLPRFRRAAAIVGVGLHVGCYVLLQDVRLDLLVFGFSSLSLYPLFFL